MINTAQKLNNLKLPPSNRLHALVGKLPAYHRAQVRTHLKMDHAYPKLKFDTLAIVDIF
jgi:hypothetical protein